jgi:imidazolonepropionase-like amidohydrolase
MRTAQLICFLLAGAAGTAAQVTVLTHATVIDGTGRVPIPDMAIVMNGGRIAEMGPATTVKTPSGAQVVDLSGKTIIPGIINLHSHINEDTERKLRQFALYGVTSTAGLGGDGDDVLKIRDAQRHGDIHGARIYTVQHRFEFEKDARTPEEARAKVDELYRKHVDAVKIVVDDRQHTQPKLKPEISLAVIDQAHKHHLKVFAHIYDLSDAKFLVDNGIDMLAHQVRDREVDDALIAAMKKRGVPVTCTLTGSLSFFVYADSPAWLNDPFLLKWAPPQQITRAKTEFKEKQAKDPAAMVGRRDLEMLSRNLRKMAAAGVKIGFGDDDGANPTRFEGYFEHLEMEYMVKNGGLTPMQVIQSFSKINSETLGIDKDFGTLAKGKAADLVVLDKNPAEDILNTRTLNAVYLAGKRFE